MKGDAVIEEAIAKGLKAAYDLGRHEGLGAAAKVALQWCDGQDRVALLKQEDAPCSAESHADCAIIGRRIAALILAEVTP